MVKREKEVAHVMMEFESMVVTEATDESEAVIKSRQPRRSG